MNGKSRLNDVVMAIELYIFLIVRSLIHTEKYTQKRMKNNIYRECNLYMYTNIPTVSSH